MGSTDLRPGAVPILMFNGIGANVELCRNFFDELAKLGVGSVVFDIPGCGESDPPLLPYRFTDIARLAIRVLEAMGVTGVIDVAGLSWGGGVAQQFAHQYPERTRKLMLFATSAGTFAYPGQPAAVFRLVNPRRYVDKGYMRRIGGSLYGGIFRHRPDMLEAYVNHMKPPTGPGYLYQLLAGIGWTSAGWLRTLEAPTLVMMGTDDPIMPVVNGKILASLIPNARLFTINDGHLFIVSRAKDVAPMLAKFLAEPMPAPEPSLILKAAS